MKTQHHHFLPILILALLLTGVILPALAQPTIEKGIFDKAEILAVDSLDVRVIDDWHVDSIDGTTRQKLIDISVAEWWPGQDFRVPVRLIVPVEAKAKGFHITGGHPYGGVRKDANLNRIEAELIKGGVGAVHTVVQPLENMPGGEALADAMLAQFLKTANPRYTTIWIWGMTLMRATTAAYAETDHFAPGKVVGSGGSKNGAAPTVALINDDRFTAACGGVSPIYASPLWRYEQSAIDEVEAANTSFFKALEAGEIKAVDPGAEHYYLRAWGVFEKVLHNQALAAGWTMDDFRRFVAQVTPSIIVAENWERLQQRGAAALFQPGTHDWVSFDILWGAQHHPEIPVYYKPNGGHGQTAHHAAPQDERNLEAFLLHQFFGRGEQLQAPKSVHRLQDGKLEVRVSFDKGPQPKSGRIWWMYDRAPAASGWCLWERIPNDQWADMAYDADQRVWTATIPFKPDARTIDFFSNHGLDSDGLMTYLSSPYTRVNLQGE